MAKQLKQLLQEKQEPFLLELYLVEKGFLRNKFNSIDHLNNKRRQKGTPKFPKLLRAVYNQVISLNDRRPLKIKSSRNTRSHHNQSDRDRKLQCRCIQESRQLRPVLEDSILSASLSKILFHSQQKVVQQTRQLLFDCVREIVETQEKKTKHEEFGKLIEEKIKCWGKQHGEESNLEYLLELEFRNWAHDYKPQGRKIGCEIGDAILDQIMNEIVMDMMI